VIEDLVDHVTLAGVDEADDLHAVAAAGQPRRHGRELGLSDPAAKPRLL